MKIILVFITSINLAFAAGLHDFKVKGAKGEEIDFSKYKGKPVLLVNIATKCGYTPQLEGLEKLSEKYAGKLTLVGVPSNDFGGQTPETNEKVAEFCKLNYGVSFPLTAKSKVKGEDKSSLYKFLVSDGSEVEWNFEKFLVGEDGKVLKRFKSNVKPMSDELTAEIEKAIK